MHHVSAGHKAREILCPPGIYQLGYGMDQVHSQNNQSTHQTFDHFKWAHCSTHPFFSQATPTDSLVQSEKDKYHDISLTYAPSPVPL